MLLGNTQEAFSSQQITSGRVIEYLRLQVTTDSREAWLTAEKGSWEPWLAKQSGFLGRQLYLDPENEEGVFLISWASRAQWKDIPLEEINSIQDDFEYLARQETGQLTGNPFPIKYQGELIPQ